MPQINLPNRWSPRNYQMPAWAAMENGCRRAVLCWHRRAGKDDFALNWTAVSAMDVGMPGSVGKVGNYWHMLPEASQARKAIWDAVDPHTGLRRIDQAFPEEIREVTREHEMFMRLKSGSTWQVVGSDNFNSLVGSPPIGVVFSEYALADPSAWAFLRPILLENKGWAMFISTPRGMNHFGRMVDFAADPTNGWFGQILTVDETKVMSKEEVDQERREIAAERGDEEATAIVNQEYYCSRHAAVPGAYFSALMARASNEGRLGQFPWVPSKPVGTSWDIGYGDSTAIWFYQIIDEKVRIIDYYEASGVGLEHYAKRIHSRPYVYMQHIWPHDGRNAEWGSGDTRPNLAKKFGIKPQVLDQIGHEDGISAARQLMQAAQFNIEPIPFPAMGDTPAETPEFAKARMNRGLDALRSYHRKYDTKLMAYGANAVHDWASHGAKSFIYLACGRSPRKMSQTIPIHGVGMSGSDKPATAIMD